MIALGKPKLHTKFEVAIFVAEILKGNRKILWRSPRPGPRPLFFCVGFYGLPSLKSLLIYYGNIRKFVLKIGINQNGEAPHYLEKLISTFPIRCATAAELRLQQTGDFLRKTAFYN